MRRSIRLLAIPFALALLATACGDDDQQPALSGDVEESETDADLTGEDTEDTDESASASAGSASFAAPEDGATVARRFTVEMTAEGVEIEPAAEGAREGAGHFHVMVDTDCVEAGEAIPKDDQHLHFGDGSTTAELTLEPGEHTLCLQVGDGAHVALPLTHTVKVTIA